MSMLSDLWHQVNGDAGAAAAKNAGDIAAQTADQSKGIIGDYTNQSLSQLSGAGANFQPFLSGGQGGLSMLQNSLGLNGPAGNQQALSAYQQSPGYQWQMDQGVSALDRSANARGGLYGGAQLKALTQYGQGLANQDYGNWQGQLSNMAGMGQNAAGSLSQLAGMKANALMGAGNSLTDLNNMKGQAQANALIGAQNAHTNALGNLLKVGGALVGSFNPADMGKVLSSAFGGGSGAGAAAAGGGLY